MAANVPANTASLTVIGVETGQGGGDIVRRQAPYLRFLMSDGFEWAYFVNSTASTLAAGAIAVASQTATTVNGQLYPLVNTGGVGTGWVIDKPVPAYVWYYAKKAAQVL